mmetsp:Transcript_39464/g.72802  ORF Transcript_39464/g.72802 Transcript_39464/m.72802 type:complete len:248 (+) Transcript_39464:630-1373(+)
MPSDAEPSAAAAFSREAWSSASSPESSASRFSTYNSLRPCFGGAKALPSTLTVTRVIFLDSFVVVAACKACTACSLESSAMCSTPRCSPAASFSRAASSALTVGGGNGRDAEVTCLGRTTSSFTLFPAKRAARAVTYKAFLELLGGKDDSPPILIIWVVSSAFVSAAGPCWRRRLSCPSGAQCDTNGTCCFCEEEAEARCSFFFSGVTAAFCILVFFVFLFLLFFGTFSASSHSASLSRGWHPPPQT